MVTSLLPLTIAEEDLRITPGTSGMRYFNSYLIALFKLFNSFKYIHLRTQDLFFPHFPFAVAFAV